ncbi:MAG: helix-hairpin-helix domain-containing protein [Burkholderiales bacterium]|nr:helix-hairpin-helix domain-containing protein [Burkholderiales bacterium]
MQKRIIKTFALGLALALCVVAVQAADKRVPVMGGTIDAAEEGMPTAKPVAKTKKKKNISPTKLVDINSASKAELMKLSGVTDAMADKIIAGRPYTTKSRLITKDIISVDVFHNIDKLIIAKQK